MLPRCRLWMALVSFALLGTVALAQEAVPPPKEPAMPTLPPPPATAVAATVNGQAIPEMAVYRALARENPKNYEGARREVLNFLIENVLVDQYLVALKISPEVKEVTDRMEQLKAEAIKEKQDFEKIMKTLYLTEAELRQQMESALRWDKFVAQQGTEKALRDLFDKNKNMFDGSQVSARHVLVKPADTTPQAGEQAKIKLVSLKKQVEDQVTQGLGKLPATTDNLAKDQERRKLLDQAFAEAAKKESDCPSKAEGGAVGFFPRAGAMVEPFARAAFALQPYQLSDVVQTEFGYHIILPVDYKAGREVKFEDMRPVVQEVYAERLREAVINHVKPRAQIVINPPAKQ